MLEIDKYSRVPIYEQLIREFERTILSGETKEETPLPSVRLLSQELSVNPNTLQKAYSELERRGLCFSVPGNGRYITRDARKILLEEKKKGLDDISRLCKELKSCGISLEEIIKTAEQAYIGD